MCDVPMLIKCISDAISKHILCLGCADDNDKRWNDDKIYAKDKILGTLNNGYIFAFAVESCSDDGR